MSITGTIRRSVDLDRGVRQTPLGQLFATTDHNAQTFEIALRASGEDFDVGGASVLGYFVRADEQTVVVAGSAAGNVVTLTLPQSCYAVAGHFSLIVKVALGDERKAVFWGDGDVTRASTDVIVDPGDVVPSLEELLARIDEMKEGTRAANTAADRANTASEQADAARDAANEAARKADTASDGAKEATRAADAARDGANAARDAANEAAQAADRAAQGADEAARAADDAAMRAKETADAAARGANEAAARAENATDAANEATRAADAARDEANRAAQAADDAARTARGVTDRWDGVGLEYEVLPPSENPWAAVDQTAHSTTFRFGLPRSNLAYSTFEVNDGMELVMTSPDGFSDIGFELTQDGDLEVVVH